MPKPERARVVVIGAGNWGRNHIRETLASKNAELIAIIDKNEEVLDNVFADIYVDNVKRGFTTTHVPASATHAIVATSSYCHDLITIALLRRGIHVLVEKPMAKSGDGARRVAHIAKQTNKCVLVGHLYRFSEPLANLIEGLPESEPAAMLRTYRHGGIFREDDDVVWSLGPHDVDIAMMIYEKLQNTQVGRVKVNCYRFPKWPGHAESAIIQLGFDSRFSSVHSVCLHTFGTKERRLDVVTQDGVVGVFDDLVEQKNIAYEPPLTRELDYFFNSWDYSRGNVQDGVRVVEILEAAALSGKTEGKTVVA